MSRFASDFAERLRGARGPSWAVVRRGAVADRFPGNLPGTFPVRGGNTNGPSFKNSGRKAATEYVPRLRKEDRSRVIADQVPEKWAATGGGGGGTLGEAAPTAPLTSPLFHFRRSSTRCTSTSPGSTSFERMTFSSYRTRRSERTCSRRRSSSPSRLTRTRR